MALKNVRGLKEVILFLVEGVSDEESLNLILSEIIRDDIIKFQITNGDITSNLKSTEKSVIENVNSAILAYSKSEKVEKKYIAQVIHLIDIDGAYIQDKKFMHEDKSLIKGFRYEEDKIYAYEKDRILYRNKKKSTLMNKLSTINEVGGVKYKAYYFCCNLDHVFHNERNLEKHKKVEYAQKFQDIFYENEKEFLKYIKTSNFAVKGTHQETWGFLKNGLNSLGRYSNFHLFFEDFKDYIKEDFKDYMKEELVAK